MKQASRNSGRILMQVTLVAALLSVGCKKEQPDKCERAHARIARINAKRSLPPMHQDVRDEAIKQCRHGRYAQYDPVLRCALDSPTDAAAAACMDEAVNSTLKPATMEKDGAGPKGINPLLKNGTDGQ